MAQQSNGMSQRSTRPSRKAQREKQAGLASMIEHAEQTPPPIADPPREVQPVQTVPPTSRLAAAAQRSARRQKVPTSTYLEVDTLKRLNWLVEQNNFVKADVIGDALDELLDRMGVPAGEALDDRYLTSRR